MCNNEVLQRRLLQAAKFGDLLERVHRKKGNTQKAEELVKQSYVLRREVAAMRAEGVKMGNIGEPIRHVELPGEEPLTVPEFDPEEAPATEPAPERVEPEPVPA